MFKTAIKLDEDAISFLAVAAAKDYLENQTPPAEAIAKVILEQNYEVTPEQVSRIVEKTNNYIYLALLKNKKGPPKFPVAKRDDVLKIIDEKIHPKTEESTEKISSLIEKQENKYDHLFDEYLNSLLAKNGAIEIEKDADYERPFHYLDVIEDLKKFKHLVEDEIENIDSKRFEVFNKMITKVANDIVNNELKLTDFVNHVFKVADEVLANEIVLALDKELRKLGFDKYAKQPEYLIRQSPVQYTYTIKTIMNADAYRDALQKLPTITNDWIIYLEKTMNDLISIGKIAEASVPETILIKIFNDVFVPAIKMNLHKKAQFQWIKPVVSTFAKAFKAGIKRLKPTKADVGLAGIMTFLGKGLTI
jgi:hypothetical protein